MTDVIGVTGWTPEVIRRQTLPFLVALLARKGRVLWPRLRPQLEAEFANVSDKGEDGKPSGVEQLIRDYEAAKAGNAPTPTYQQKRRQLARRIYLMEYLGDPEAGQDRAAAPELELGEVVEGLSSEAAAGVLAWIAAGECPDELWADEFMHMLPHLRATADEG